MNIRKLIETTTDKNPNKIFLYYGEQEITYKEFNENINKAANLFLELGLKKGDHVCFFLPNCPEFLYAWLGLVKIGAVLVPINTHYKIEETKYIVNHSEANTIFVHSSLKTIVDKIRPEAPLLKNFILFKEDAKNSNYISFDEAFRNASTKLVPVDISEDDICEIMYTSGTTGPSKGVMMSHKYWVLNGLGFKFPMDVTPEDRLFTCLPLFHANAQGYSTMGALTAGASLILVDRFSASKFWDQIRYYKATVFNYIGAMIPILSKQPESEKDRDHHVRAAYGTPAFDEEFKDYIEQRYGITLVTGYGLTECGLCLIQPLYGLRKERSMGLPKQIPGIGFVNKAKIVDENDREVTPGEVGEIKLKNPVMMKGYFKDAELTNKVLSDGWLSTGDYASKDEDGYFYFADRKKDVIRRRGENVSSLEVENVINAHPKLLESAVIAVPSELYDDEIKAYVIIKPNEKLDPIEIIEWCKDRLAYFKVPRFIEFRSELPKTPTHRVQKYILRKEKKDPTKDCFDLEKVDFKIR
jgi:crotonobetaine/carnitine-CoA ligase